MPRIGGERSDTAAVEYANAAQCISDAQNSLYGLRRTCESCCIVAEGRACCIALALAAQLVVDRIVLCGRQLFFAQEGDRDRQLRRIENFAVRNMSLIAAEIVLIGADGAQLRALVRMLGRHAGNVRIGDTPSGGTYAGTPPDGRAENI